MSFEGEEATAWKERKELGGEELRENGNPTSVMFFGRGDQCATCLGRWLKGRSEESDTLGHLENHLR